MVRVSKQFLNDPRVRVMRDRRRRERRQRDQGREPDRRRTDRRHSPDYWEDLRGAVGLVVLGIPLLALFLAVLPFAVVFKLLLWPVEQTRFARNLGRDIDSFSDRHPWIIYALALPLALLWRLSSCSVSSPPPKGAHPPTVASVA